MKKEKAETIQLKVKIKSLEREIEGCLTRFLNQGIVTENFMDDGLELDRKLTELNLSIQRLTLLVANPGNNTGKDYLYKVKCLMELIESKILVFKAEQMERMKELETAERTCYQDIKIMEVRINKADYNLLDSSTNSTSATSKSFIQDAHFSFDKNASGLLPAVVDFQKYVAKYGHDNGWDPVNHASFIKLRKKYGSGTENLYEACQERLLHVTYQMAVDHDQWFTLYEEKSNANKAAIQKWKTQKTNNVAAAQIIADKQLVYLADIKSREPSKEAIKCQKIREFKRFELALWKREQSRIKAEQEEKKILEEEENAAKQKRDMLVRKKELERKKQLQSAVEKSCAAVKESTSAQSIAERKNNNILVLALQKEREEQVLKKRQDMLKKKRTQEAEKEQRLQKLIRTVQVSVTRDPERLFKPTKGSIQKSTSNETLSDSKSNSLVNLQRRAIPLWRISKTIVGVAAGTIFPVDVRKVAHSKGIMVYHVSGRRYMEVHGVKPPVPDFAREVI